MRGVAWRGVCCQRHHSTRGGRGPAITSVCGCASQSRVIAARVSTVDVQRHATMEVVALRVRVRVGMGVGMGVGVRVCVRVGMGVGMGVGVARCGGCERLDVRAGRQGVVRVRKRCTGLGGRRAALAGRPQRETREGLQGQGAGRAAVTWGAHREGGTRRG